MQCTNQLKQWSLACHNYHDTLQTFPPLGTRQVSWMVLLLPYIEQQSVTEMIAGGGTAASMDGTTPYAAGPPNDNSDMNYRPWRSKLPVRICPSDANSAEMSQDIPDRFPGTSSYRGCLGDCATNMSHMYAFDQEGSKMRGAFILPDGWTFGAITDGTSNTVFFGEVLIGSSSEPRSARSGIAYRSSGGNLDSPDRCLAALSSDRSQIRSDSNFNGLHWSGRRWSSPVLPYSGFTTAGSPNSVSCLTFISGAVNGNDGNAPIYPLSSNHTGGGNTAFGDGSVHFINNTIDVGSTNISVWHTANPAAAGGATQTYSQSPYGLWGALGTINCGEAKGL
jgi:prepilin-type processing-associated H-X9-DG protein